jgi:hypothetical protein
MNEIREPTKAAALVIQGSVPVERWIKNRKQRPIWKVVDVVFLSDGSGKNPWGAVGRGPVKSIPPPPVNARNSLLLLRHTVAVIFTLRANILFHAPNPL